MRIEDLVAAALAAALGACAGVRPLPGSERAVRRVEIGQAAEGIDEIVAPRTRGDVRQPFLLATVAGARPRAVALMFPGGPGVVDLPADVDRLERGSYFFLRARDLFRDREVAVAILDAPTDHADGMYDDFRTGREHVEDVAAVLKELRARFPGAKVFLVGTSRGTVSVAHLGRALGTAVDGVVLASTVLSGHARSLSLRGFDFGAIAAPILFVHHAADGCWACPYAPAAELGASYPLVTVRGGLAARSEDCGPLSAHGYYGKEAETVAAIKSWMLGRPYPRLVE